MERQKSLLRLVATGSVDDGKSTLMGRLLFETRSILDDQLDAVKKTSARRGQGDVDLSLLLDGLAAEREQCITIDVAYRYFETAHRRFILADCPGHEQYTRNMVTGASTADCAVLLLDAQNGVGVQSRRHGFILSLLQVPHVLVVVNKMDLVGFSRDAYDAVVEEYETYARRLEIRDLAFLPACALDGDNITRRSERLAWFEGPTLLQYLESVHLAADRNLIDFRFPVQGVIRPTAQFRGFAGRVASGTIRVGEEVAVLPSGRTSRVRAIETFDGPLDEAFAPQSVVICLEDEVDVSRGCMLVRPRNVPEVGSHLEATLCWMDDRPLRPGSSYYLKHTTQTVRAVVSKLVYRFDVGTLHRQPAAELGLNDLGRVEVQTTLPLCFDPYRLNRATGSFILIDPETSRTAAAGIIRGKPARVEDAAGGSTASRRSANTVAHAPTIPREVREGRNGHESAVLWLTGLSGAGKSTIGRGLERLLFERGCQVMLLDGDRLRAGLCGDLGFTAADRTENIRRAGEVAALLFEAGHIVICTFISPIAKDRAFVRSLFPPGRFMEVHVECPLEVCVARDPNGLYRRALEGAIGNFTGISAGYEVPAAPEVTVRTDQAGVEVILAELVARLEAEGILASAERRSGV